MGNNEQLWTDVYCYRNLNLNFHFSTIGEKKVNKNIDKYNTNCIFLKIFKFPLSVDKYIVGKKIETDYAHIR